MVKILLLSLFFCFFLAMPMEAQRIFQLEKSGSLKTLKFYEGDEVVYRLQGDKTWHKSIIETLKVEDQLVIFNHRYAYLNEITDIRLFKNQEWSKKAGRQLYLFGVSWSGFALGGSLTPNYSYRARDAIVTGSAFLTGFLLQKIFKQRSIKLGKRHRLRLLEIP